MVAAPVAASSFADSPCLAPLPAAGKLQAEVRERLDGHRLRLLQAPVPAETDAPPLPARHSPEPKTRHRYSATQNSPTQISPDSQADRYGSLGQLYHAHLIFGPAEVCYRAVLSLTPDDARAHYLLGYLHQQRGQPDAAAASYRRALALQPGLRVAALRLALILADQQHPDAARQLLLTARHDPATRTWTQFQLGQLALAEQRYPQAIEWLQQALLNLASEGDTAANTIPNATNTTAPPSPGIPDDIGADTSAGIGAGIPSGIHYPLAMAYRALGDRRQARHHLSLNNGQPPTFADPLVEQLERLKTLKSAQRQHYTDAIAAIERRDYPAAIAAFSAGLADDQRVPQSANARTSLARALFLNGEQAAAGALLRQVVADSDAPLALFLLGVWLEQQGRLQQAQSRYRQVLSQHPAHAGAQLLLADQLLRQRAWADAASHYQQAWQLDPENHRARLRQIIALAALGESEASLLAMLRQAANDHPQDPAIRYYLVRLLALASNPQTRDTATAAALAATLYRDFPGPNQAELMALTAAADGRFEQALDWLQAAIDTARTQAPQLLPALQALHQRYREHQPPVEAPFPMPVSIPAVDAERIFRDYPSTTPY